MAVSKTGSCLQLTAVALLASWTQACAGRASETTPIVAPSAPPAAEDASTRLELKPVPLRPMTERERNVETDLRQNMATLLASGERHSGNEWGLASATDTLAAQLESRGITVVREGFMGPTGELGQNLVVNFPGTDLPQEVVLIGAQYDSAPGSPGADDNATGAAALLEVAKSQYGKTRRRTLRLVWFSDASRRTQPDFMGAWHHFELAAKPKSDDEPGLIGSDLRLCIDLHGLGAFSEQLGSQHYAPGMPLGHSIGEFIEVQSLPQYMAQASAVSSALGDVSSVPIKSVTTLETEAALPMTPFAAFAAHGCPAVLVHDTGALRFAEFGKAGDTPEHIDFGRFARIVDAVVRATDLWVNAPVLGAESAQSTPPDVRASGQEPSE